MEYMAKGSLKDYVLNYPGGGLPAVRKLMEHNLTCISTSKLFLSCAKSITVNYFTERNDPHRLSGGCGNGLFAPSCQNCAQRFGRS